MIPYPHINPEIVRIGPFAVRWYGLMYLAGFASSYFLVQLQVRKKQIAFKKDFIDSLYPFMIFGLIIGARLGYVLFYNFSYYSHHPLETFAMWQGGMSFHGGLIGGMIGLIWCSRRYHADPWLTSDLIAATAPIGLGLGRIGNFINGELYGRVTDVPWAMVFPQGGPLPRHPSQLYEFFLEGVVLFLVLWIAKDKVSTRGAVTAFSFILYGAFRFGVEFLREPDAQLGFILGPFTMGQVLSVCTIIAGIALYSWRRSSQVVRR